MSEDERKVELKDYLQKLKDQIYQSLNVHGLRERRTQARDGVEARELSR